MPDLVNLRSAGYPTTVEVHVTERTDGRWSCATDRLITLHDRLPEVIAHIRASTRTLGADVLIRWINGDVDNIGPI